jgi:hypothetical protein
MVLYVFTPTCFCGLHVTFTHTMEIVFSVLHFWTKEPIRTVQYIIAWLHSAGQKARRIIRSSTKPCLFVLQGYDVCGRSGRIENMITSRKFRQKTYISVCVLRFQITRWERKCHEVNREALTVAHCSLYNSCNSRLKTTKDKEIYKCSVYRILTDYLIRGLRWLGQEIPRIFKTRVHKRPPLDPSMS